MPLTPRGSRDGSSPRFRWLVPFYILIFLANGCHSASISATIHNHTSNTISLIQVDYPSASFGIQTLASGADYKYRFKILGSGPVKITYTDTGHTEHKSDGPNLSEREEGTLDIDVAADGVHWKFHQVAK